MLAIDSKNADFSFKCWLRFIIANASNESRQRLVRLFTHSSIQALHLQYLLGMKEWTADMFDLIPRLQIGNPMTIGHFFSAYVGIAHCRDGTYAYSGSASGLYSGYGLVGEAARMYDGHRPILSLKESEIKRRRSDPDDTEVLYIHEKMGEATAAGRFFFSAPRFPVQFDKTIDDKTAVLAQLGENCNMILLGCHSTQRPRSHNYHKIRLVEQLWAKSGLALNAIRPLSLPDSPWKGANKILPIFQKSYALLRIVRLPYTRDERLKSRLLEHFDKTCAQQLSRSVIEGFISEFDLPNNDSSKVIIVGEYTSILKGHGLQYMSRYRRWLKNLTIIWFAVIQHANESGLVEGPNNNRYVLHEAGIDWTQISQIAQKITSSDSAAMYSKEFCFWNFHETYNRHFKEMIVYEWNWKRLEGEHLLYLLFIKANFYCSWITRSLQ